MSPEAIELPDGMRRLKVGRPSDVWSLGCILYQMVYGGPPFQHLSTVFQKMRAIPDSTHEIDFPETSVPIAPAVPKPKDANGMPDGRSTPGPPKRLEHLARPVRKDVISTMKRCLVRNPKDRATIPELLEDDWLLMREPPPPPKDPTPPPPRPPTPEPAPSNGLVLKDDETIINPFYMRQLFQYAIKVAQEGETCVTEEQQIARATVSIMLASLANNSTADDIFILRSSTSYRNYELSH